MATKAKELNVRLGQSFSKKEIDLVCTVFMTLFRKGDPGVLLERPEMRSVSKKFLSMQKKLQTKEVE